MNADRWRQIEELYHAARLRPPDERQAFLAAASADGSVAREVESLLAQDGRADNLLERPVWDSVEDGDATPEVPGGGAVSRYQITGKLGEGGMGVVWKAWDSTLNRWVAIKTLPAGAVDDESLRKRFMQEARAASALNHPNIATVYDLIHQDGSTFLVMELVEGKSLADQIPRNGLRVSEALKCAVQIADALAAAHRAGIVHRDLKPRNIMVTPEGRVKVLDFGLAKLVWGGERNANLTHSGFVIGSGAYMSPEQAEGREVDSRSDIFSFGAVLYEIVSGKRAFPGDSMAAAMAAVMTGPAPTLAGAPPELDRIVQRCLRKDRERRAQHLDDIKVELEDLKAAVEKGSPAENLITKRRRVRWPSIAATFAAACGLAAWYWIPRSPWQEELVFQPVPLTSYAGSETEPALAPDGSLVAFSWDGEKRDNFDIYVRLVSGGQPLRLTSNAAPDKSPVWSPDGSRIAFLRENPGGDQSVIIISPLGGQERIITNVARHFAVNILSWSADSESILFADRPAQSVAFSIFKVSVTSGMRKKLTDPPAGYFGDLSPSASPDGKFVVFGRHHNSTFADVYVVDLEHPAVPKKLAGGVLSPSFTSISAFQGAAWMPSGDEIIYSANGNLLRCRIKSEAAPKVVFSGDRAAARPTISRTGRLVFAMHSPDSNLWRLTRTGSQPVKIVASNYADDFPHISSDAARLVFASARTGKFEIWTASVDGSNPAQVTSLRQMCHSPRFSPDGASIAFSCLVGGNRDIYVVDASGGGLRRLTTDPAEEGRPSWSRDGRWIYFYVSSDGSMNLWKMPAEGGARVQVTSNGGHSAEESPDGRDTFYSKGYATGVFRRPVAGGAEERVIEKAHPGWWAVTQQGIYYAEVPTFGEFLAPPIPIHFWGYSGLKVANIATINYFIHLPSAGLTASIDGKTLIWAQTVVDSDLMLVDPFR